MDFINYNAVHGLSFAG